MDIPRFKCFAWIYVVTAVRFQLLQEHIWPCICRSDLRTQLHRSSSYLLILGTQVPVKGAGLPQGSSKSPPVPIGPLDAPLPKAPVLETGQAGPPSKVTSTSKLPKGTDGSMMPVQGFAGAPGETHQCKSIKCFMVRPN